MSNPDAEERGMKDFLSTFPEDELKGLLKTVTNHLVTYGSVPRDANGRPTMDAKTHAIHSLFMYSNVMTLLDKQKVKKSYLADYLNQKGVRMTIPATKRTLVNDVLDFWRRGMCPNLRVDDNAAIRVQPLPTAENPEPPAPVNGKIQRSEVNHTIAHQAIQSASGNQLSSTETNTPSNVVNIPAGQDIGNVENEDSLSIRQRVDHVGQQLATEFSRWYYERLNTLTDFTVSHFWAECNLRLEIIFAVSPNNAIIEEVTNNGGACCAKIKDLVAVKELWFNPNCNDAGVRGYLNPHGLAQVMVCGTIHQRDGPSPAIGVFEQMFGLMKDPSQHNNFKIRFSVLRLREGNYLAIQNTPPELLDSSLVGIVEEIDDDD